MKSEQLPTLRQYSLFSAAFIAIQSANGQTVYTDIDPDIILFEEENMFEGWKYLDLDNDAVTDVGFEWVEGYDCGYCPGFLFFNVALADGNQMATAVDDACSLYSSFYGNSCYFPPAAVADVFKMGDTIHVEQSFGVISDVFQIHDCGYLYGPSCWQGFFAGSYGTLDEQFLVVKLADPDSTRCWIRLNWSGYMLSIDDYLCNHNAEEDFAIEEPVLTGIYSAVDSFNIYYADNTIHISNLVNNGIAYLMVYDLQGRMVWKSLLFSNAQTIETNFAAGMYVAVVQSDSVREARRFVVN